MLVVYGSKYYGRKNAFSTMGVCENCGHFGPLRHFNGKKWGHIYYIPLIPSGPRSRVVNECKNCETVMAIPEKNVPKMVVEILEDVQQLIATEREIENEPETLNATLASIAGYYELIVKLHAMDGENKFKSLLDRSRFKLARAVVDAKAAEMKGEDHTLERILEGESSAVNLPYINLTLADAYLRTNQLNKAEERFLIAAAADHENIYPRYMLLMIYKANDDRGRFLSLYNEVVAIDPKLAKDKAIKKYYKAITKGH